MTGSVNRAGLAVRAVSRAVVSGPTRTTIAMTIAPTINSASGRAHLLRLFWRFLFERELSCGHGV